MELIPAPKRQRTSMFDSNNIYHQTSMDSIDQQYSFKYHHRQSQSQSYSNSNSQSRIINSANNCLSSILHLNNEYNNKYDHKNHLNTLWTKSISSMTGILQFLDDQSLIKLKQTSKKMAQITKNHEYIHKNDANNHHLSRSYTHHNVHKRWNNDVQYVQPVRSSYNVNINVDNNEHHIPNNNHPHNYSFSFNLNNNNNTKSMPISHGIMSSNGSMSMSNTYETNCNAIKSNININIPRRKFRTFCHTIEQDQEYEFALNDINIELDEDIDINMSMAASFINTEKETRNYNTSVSNTLSPLSCLQAPAPLALGGSMDTLDIDNFNLNTNKYTISTPILSIRIDTNHNQNNNNCNNYHSTIIGHRINEYAEDGNEDKDIYDQNRCSVLDVLNDIEQFSL